MVRDIGGYVKDYREQTEVYRRENREVRLQECRSACTLALSLPNVCVYPDSLIRFHQAYDEQTRIIDQSVSQDLFLSYPPAIRARLGALTRQYQTLLGAELIELGIRDCTQKRTILIAKDATPQERGTGIAQAMSELMTKILPSASPAPSSGIPKARAVEVASLKPAQSAVPLPPSKPTELTASSQVKSQIGQPLDVSPLKLMQGALPLLPSSFSAYAPLKPFQVRMIESHLR